MVNQQISEQVFREQMQRMFAVWTVADREIRAGKAMEFRRIFERVGEKRFTAAVDTAIQCHATGFFPTPGEFYVPDAPKVEGSYSRTMEEILEKQKEWDEPETMATLKKIDRMIKGGFKDMNSELKRGRM